MSRVQRRLLFVEDDEGVAQGLGHIFERWRPVCYALTVAEAKAALASGEEIAGAVIDFTLPDGDGLEIAEEIRRRFPHMPLLLLTGTHEPEVISRCFSMDIPYLEKGVSWDIRKFMAELDEVERAEEPESKADRVFAATVAGKGLTQRKRAVARQRLRHASRAEAARALGVSENTVKAHMREILRQLDVPNVTTLAHRVLRESLSEPSDSPAKQSDEAANDHSRNRDPA